MHWLNIFANAKYSAKYSCALDYHYYEYSQIYNNSFNSNLKPTCNSK